MHETLTAPQAPPHESSRSALDFIHRLLSVPPEGQSDLNGLLGEVSAAFKVSGAGLATLPEGAPFAIHPSPPQEALTEAALPWREQSGVNERLLQTRGTVAVPRPAGGSFLVAVLGIPECGGWLLWLEDASRTQWSETESSLLILAGYALTHHLSKADKLPPWAAQLDRAIRRQRMDAASRLVRRLAHDFGNILTGILGFSELALAEHLAPSSPLHSYISEVHRSAKQGAQYTDQLRLFARRQAASNRSCNLAAVLMEEEARLQPLLGANVQLKLDVPADLPAVVGESEPLKQALAIVLDNAREAITGGGVIEVTARTVQLNTVEARELFGDVRPGTHVEIRVADTGSGLNAEVQRRLFTEPFFSTKPRKRGFGLAMAYGVLSAHRGGLELLPRPEEGTIARLLLPVAAVAVASEPRSPSSTQPRPLTDAGGSQAPARRERILVVDDDRMILQLLTTTLERAGYRVQTAAHAEEAVKSYRDSTGDPFALVLSDVLMPDVNGVELVRRLLSYDANVPVLFMSGQVPGEIMNQAFGPGRFEVLSKPFRPEGLIRAIRAAIDRSSKQARKSACGMKP